MVILGNGFGFDKLSQTGYKRPTAKQPENNSFWLLRRAVPYRDHVQRDEIGAVDLNAQNPNPVYNTPTEDNRHCMHLRSDIHTQKRSHPKTIIENNLKKKNKEKNVQYLKIEMIPR